MANIQIGAIGAREIDVDDRNAITFLGPEGPRVLSTPSMIGYMEATCRDLVLPMVDAGDDTVGTHVDVRHLGAAPMGARVRFRSEILSVEGRRVRFKVEAFFGDQTIGAGTHERFVITVARFAKKL